MSQPVSSLAGRGTISQDGSLGWFGLRASACHDKNLTSTHDVGKLKSLKYLASCISEILHFRTDGSCYNALACFGINDKFGIDDVLHQRSVAA